MLRLLLVFGLGYLVGSVRRSRPIVSRLPVKVPATSLPTVRGEAFKELGPESFVTVTREVAPIDAFAEVGRASAQVSRIRDHFFVWVPGAPDPNATVLHARQYADTDAGLTCFSSADSPFYLTDFDILSQNYSLGLPFCERLTDPSIDGTVYELQRRPH